MSGVNHFKNLNMLNADNAENLGKIFGVRGKPCLLLFYIGKE